MKTRRLLYLSAHQMTAYLWRPGELRSEAQFAATEVGHQQFAAYLARNSKSIYSILANVSEEGFQVETIPFLQGADRKAVIDRKLGQLFFNAELTASLSLGYEKSKRKNERILLAALTNNQLFAPWLLAVKNAGVALAGLYSLPLLAPSLLRKLHLGDDHCLLLTVQDQSIRQNYLEKGELIFSRLTPLQNSSIVGMAQSFSAEALKLQQYLASQRLVARNQAITAYILANAGAHKTIEASCINTPTIQYRLLDVEDCARRTGLKTSLPDPHSEPLFLNLLVTAPPGIQFANDDRRHDHHLGQIRSALQALGALALIGCLLFSGKLLFDARAVEEEAGSLRAEAVALQQRYGDIAKTFPPIPTSNETLRRIIDRYVELESKAGSPDGLYREISRAMQAAPAAELQEIDWKVGGAEKTPANAAPATAATSAPIPGDSEAALVHGTLKLGSNANARQMLQAFNGFVDALRANPRLRVEVLQRPFDIESGKSLKGVDTTLGDDKPRAFSIQIIRKLGS